MITTLGVRNVAVGAVLLVLSCSQKSTETVSDTTSSFAFYSSKCLGSILFKGAQHDSSFAYSFGDTLALVFSVSANCCPDSDRFAVSSAIGSDTLIVSVIDTARYSCRCICPYFIHAEFANLPKDHYVVRCRLVNVDAPSMNEDPIYLVDVYRARMWKTGNTQQITSGPTGLADFRRAYPDTVVR